MIIVGLDVGYANLKIAVGKAGGAPTIITRPAGAAPMECLGEPIGEGRRPEDAMVVDVDGQRWAAAVEPVRLEGWQRSLHEDYATTPAYEALVKAALALANQRHVDRLVTGLPVSQARDADRRAAVRRMLVGRHPTPLASSAGRAGERRSGKRQPGGQGGLGPVCCRAPRQREPDWRRVP
jgi:plasmid segregation protein ParM